MWICLVIIIIGIPLVASGKAYDFGFWLDKKFAKNSRENWYE